MIVNNKVVHKLKELGYKFVAFSSDFDLTDGIQTADIYNQYFFGLNYFEFTLLNNSLIGKAINLIQYDLNDIARGRFNNNLNRLSQIAEIETPTFTFLHVLQPHPPFIFDGEGNAIGKGKRFHLGDGSEFPGTKIEYKQGYIGQLKYLNQQIKETISEILDNSPTPPIIILQSDHGSGMYTDWENPANTNFWERMSILNAYLVPEKIKSRLYPAITPVNTFRLLFDAYFEHEYTLLEDKSYFATRNRPYKFYSVVNDRLVE